MTSLQTRARQANADGGYFITVGDLRGLAVTTPFSNPAPWASTGLMTGTDGQFSTAISTVARAGALLRDMGKTIVSSGAHFRKVQLVVPQAANSYGLGAGSLSTFGVGGPQGLTGTPDFFTGYIKLGFEGQGNPAPVASFGR